MTNPIIKIVNAETGEEIIRPMNEEELSKWESDEAEIAILEQHKLERAAERAALLERLGITEEEARLLLS
jgi:hypothetical protein